MTNTGSIAGESDPSALPYHDTKQLGAADFYFAINATFAFVRKDFGMAGLIEYWRGLGMDYMKPVWSRWKEKGLAGIESYWRAFFAAEPGGSATVTRTANEVVLDIAICPAISHLRAGGRAICPEFCQHCYYISDAAAEKAGYAVRITGGNGSCRQRFFVSCSDEPPQNPGNISPC